MIKRSFITAGLMAAFAMTSTTALAEECAERGALDAMFCDANGDLVADAPTDESMLKDPSTLVFAYTPVEDPAIYEDIWTPFIDHLSEVTGKKVQFFLPLHESSHLLTALAGRSSGGIVAEAELWQG